MEKLDRILQAEEAARDLLNDARTSAAATVADAKMRAAQITRDSRAQARDQAARVREDALSVARDEAAAVTTSAHAEAATVLARAHEREQQALSAALEVLKGR